MRAVLSVFAAVVLAATGAGCARVTAVGNAAEPPAAAGDWPAGAKEAEVYAQVLRRYLSAPGENSFPAGSIAAVYVLDRAVPGAADPVAPKTGGEPIAESTQREVVAALADLHVIRFIADRATVIVKKDGCEQVKDGGILVNLGPVDGDDNDVTVGVYGYVACLGATWLTYTVHNDSGAGGWRVTGTTGPMAIS
ncbi:hypothetical protein F4553_000960 [Allocatelliglobosispora scoriae]|uniref:Lipoprotein n=1 Tax=Allocatelliglobosispora scoriae TaxID=643052 RepID=A0A841BL38_9ACTN|nr:hypothetical protein [Allocatelliglobosispora scoriae]MBB5867581.1 hypothetical protein [Allocatelliglobosispora scoriae]